MRCYYLRLLHVTWTKCHNLLPAMLSQAWVSLCPTNPWWSKRSYEPKCGTSLASASILSSVRPKHDFAETPKPKRNRILKTETAETETETKPNFSFRICYPPTERNFSIHFHSWKSIRELYQQQSIIIEATIFYSFQKKCLPKSYVSWKLVRENSKKFGRCFGPPKHHFYRITETRPKRAETAILPNFKTETEISVVHYNIRTM